MSRSFPVLFSLDRDEADADVEKVLGVDDWSGCGRAQGTGDTNFCDNTLEDVRNGVIGVTREGDVGGSFEGDGFVGGAEPDAAADVEGVSNSAGRIW